MKFQDNDTNEYWRQNPNKYPINEDLTYEEHMKIIKEEKQLQREIDDENYNKNNC